MAHGLRQAEEKITWARNIIEKDELGNYKDRNKLERLESEIRQAIEAEDYDLLEIKLEDLRNIIKSYEGKALMVKGLRTLYPKPSKEN